MTHSTKLILNSAELLVPEMLFIAAGLIIQSVYILVLLEIISFLKGSPNSKATFTISFVLCTVARFIIYMNNQFENSVNNKVQTYEIFFIWTLISVLTSLMTIKPRSKNTPSDQ